MLNKEIAYNDVMKNISSFYKDYMVDDKLLKTITIAYMNGVDMLINYTNSIFNNLFVKTAETTRQFPYISFDASDSIYTLTRIARTPRINFYLGVPSTYTESEIMDYWKYSASPEVKTSILDMMGIYTELVTGDYVRALLEGESEDRYKGEILNADVYHKNTAKINNVDYVIKNNKFYILNLNEFDVENPYITMKNITLDYNMSWLRTGSYLGVKYSDVVGRVEYNNLNKLFIEIASRGPILNDMKESIKAMFPGENIQMLDYFSRENEKSHYWDTASTAEEKEEYINFLKAVRTQQIARAITNTFNVGELAVGQGLDDPNDNIVDEGKGLSVHDFVLCMPRTIAYPSINGEDSKIDMFRKYLDIIKPADSYYFISWIEDTLDTLKPRDYQELVADSLDDISDTLEYSESESFVDIDEVNTKVSNFDYATRLDYSSGIFCDDSVIYCDMDNYEIDIKEEPHVIEHVAIFLNTFPEAPIGLSANYANGAVNVSFQNTGAGASYYEVYRNNTLISKITIDSSDRSKRLAVKDKKFSNIKTDEYKIRTVYLDKGKDIEEAEYSHFSVVSVTA